MMTPTFVEKWLYIGGIPYIETLDIVHRQYELRQYVGV